MRRPRSECGLRRLAAMGLVCASCGAEHAPGARFCSECGAPLQRTCPACGFKQPAGATFCSNCGIALRDDARRAGDASDDRQERRVVTVLFADLAGSTALGERLDPADVRELQGKLFELDRRLERGANEGRIRTGAARLRKPFLTQAGIQRRPSAERGRLAPPARRRHRASSRPGACREWRRCSGRRRRTTRGRTPHSSTRGRPRGRGA